MRAACVVAFAGSSVLFVCGYTSGLGVNASLPGETWYAIGSCSGTLVLVRRNAPDGASGALKISLGGRLPLDSKGRLDITAPQDAIIGPFQWRDYTTHWQILGITWQTGREASSMVGPRGWATTHYLATDAWILAIPWWPILLITGVGAAFVVRRRVINRQRRRSGLCLCCGYDLRQSFERCPECGIAPSKLGRGG
ncbi:MAG TPA: hypothetical protein VKU44_00615 [Terriglobia bacterium]|nr:hypothetical protein [Terriglobia bacterium]